MGLLGGAAAVPAVRGQCRSTRPVSQAQAAISTRFRAAAARPASTSRAGPLHGLHCLQPVRGFGDDLDVVLGTQSHRESGARWRLCDAGAAPTRGSQRAPGWLRIRFRSRFGYIRMAVVPGTLLNSPARSAPGPPPSPSAKLRTEPEQQVRYRKCSPTSVPRYPNSPPLRLGCWAFSAPFAPRPQPRPCPAARRPAARHAPARAPGAMTEEPPTGWLKRPDLRSIPGQYGCSMPRS